MKILVIQQKMIGDVLTSSILFEALRKKFPGAQLHYLIQPHTIPVIENNPFIDEVVLFDPDFHKSPTQFFSFLNRIKQQEYTHIIDVYAKINSALITYYSGAGERISYHKWYTSTAYSHTFVPKKNPKTIAGLAIENRMLLLQGISKDFPQETKPKIYLRASERKAAKKKLEEAGVSLKAPLIMAGILGSSPSKTYPLNYMAEVLDFIVSKSDAQLLFNYIPTQEELAKELFQLCSSNTRKRVHFNVFGKSLREFMAITSHCDALIGNEGGAVNMAKAMDVPTFSIFSPQIKKETWSSYEGQSNIGIHLKDFNPAIVPNLKMKKGKAMNMYQAFKPELFFFKLQEFLQHVISD